MRKTVGTSPINMMKSTQPLKIKIPIQKSVVSKKRWTFKPKILRTNKQRVVGRVKNRNLVLKRVKGTTYCNDFSFHH